MRPNVSVSTPRPRVFWFFLGWLMLSWVSLPGAITIETEAILGVRAWQKEVTPVAQAETSPPEREEKPRELEESIAEPDWLKPSPEDVVIESVESTVTQPEVPPAPSDFSRSDAFVNILGSDADRLARPQPEPVPEIAAVEDVAVEATPEPEGRSEPTSPSKLVRKTVPAEPFVEETLAVLPEPPAPSEEHVAALQDFAEQIVPLFEASESYLPVALELHMPILEVPAAAPQGLVATPISDEPFPDPHLEEPELVLAEPAHRLPKPALGPQTDVQRPDLYLLTELTSGVTIKKSYLNEVEDGYLQRRAPVEVTVAPPAFPADRTVKVPWPEPRRTSRSEPPPTLPQAPPPTPAVRIDRVPEPREKPPEPDDAREEILGFFETDVSAENDARVAVPFRVPFQNRPEKLNSPGRRAEEGK